MRIIAEVRTREYDTVEQYREMFREAFERDLKQDGLSRNDVRYICNRTPNLSYGSEELNSWLRALLDSCDLLGLFDGGENVQE